MSEPYCFIDTAFVIRQLTRDVEPLSTYASALFAAIEREELTAQTSVTVVLETIYVMTTQYHAGRIELAEGLASLLALDGIELAGKRHVLEALQLWALIRRLSFADAYHLVLTKYSLHKRIATFDKGMDNCLPNVTRIEQFP